MAPSDKTRKSAQAIPAGVALVCGGMVLPLSLYSAVLGERGKDGQPAPGQRHNFDTSEYLRFTSRMMAKMPSRQSKALNPYLVFFFCAGASAVEWRSQSEIGLTVFFGLAAIVLPLLIQMRSKP
jgi:hypothetical protein